MSNNKTYLFIGAAIIVVVAALSIVFYSSDKAGENNTETSDSSSEGAVAGAMTQGDAEYAEALAKDMSEKGMVLYGTYWCSYCEKQKNLFGEAFKYVDYVECDAKGENGNPDECLAQEIEGYPTWIFQGEKYSGVQSLDDLAQIVDFKWDR